MQIDREKANLDAGDAAWELFSKTGNIGAYMLHKQLNNTQD